MLHLTWVILKSIGHQFSLSAARWFSCTVILWGFFSPSVRMHSNLVTGWCDGTKACLLYKQILKVTNKNCNILQKYNFLHFDNFLFYSDACLMFLFVHNLDPPPPKEFLPLPSCERAGRTRASTRGTTAETTVFSSSTFSVDSSEEWNSTLLNMGDSESFADAN